MNDWSQMIENTFKISKITGPTILLLDCYYLSVYALQDIKKLNDKRVQQLYLVTKAKHSCKALHYPLRLLPDVVVYY